MKIRFARTAAFTLTEIMIVVGIIGILAPIAIPNFLAARANSQRVSCINNIRMIDDAKQQWALNTGQTTEPAAADLAPYVNVAVDQLHCPQDPARTLLTSYNVGAMDARVDCLIQPADHILQ